MCVSHRVLLQYKKVYDFGSRSKVVMSFLFLNEIERERRDKKGAYKKTNP